MNVKRKWLLVGIGSGITFASLIQLGLIIWKVNVSFGTILTGFILGGIVFSFVFSHKKVKGE